MFSYNSQTWVPQVAIDHAVDILNDINNTRKSLSLPIISATTTNIIWLILLAVGDMRSVFDTLLFSAQNSLNPAECDDSQVLNLLPIVGTGLEIGTYSTVDVTITANNSGNVFIPNGSTMVLNSDVSFIVQEDTTILATESDTITLIANIRGPVIVVENQLTQFSINIANISTITNTASVLGNADETVNQVRQRIIEGTTLPDLDGIIKEIRSLQGISDAVVYFNPDPVNTLTLTGGLIIAKRTAQILVIGDSPLIANAFWKTLLNTQGTQTQNYTTLSGQLFPIKYSYATTQVVYVNIYIPHDITIAGAIATAIKNIVLTLQPNLKLGQPITSAMVDQLFTTFTGITICGSDLSLNNSDFYKEILVNATSVGLLNFNNINIVNL